MSSRKLGVKKRQTFKRSVISGGATDGSLLGFGNLGALLCRAAESDRECGITFVEDQNKEQYFSYRDIYLRARKILTGLRGKGISQGEFAILCFRSNVEFVAVFWACVLGGITPVPVASPGSLLRKSDAVTKLSNIIELLDKPRLISDGALGSDAELESILAIRPKDCIDSTTLAVGADIEVANAADVALDDIAFIQFSSGSTGKPKGVALTHRNLLTNLEGIIAGLKGTLDDKYLSWMPYHHDMGLIGFHLTPMAQLVSQVNIPSMRFIQRPMLWINKVDEHRATITSSPNFGYSRFLEKYKKEAGKDWDLSCIRLIFNGAEPISARVMARFMEALADRELKPSAMYPVYGMAEASLAVSFPDVDEKPMVHVIDRLHLAKESKVSLVSADDPHAMEVVDLGTAIPGVDVRVVSDKDRPVGEGRIGHIQIRGDNVTSGYFNNDEVNKEAYVGGWLRTGDLGFIWDSRLSVTGRAKDIIFINGQNFFAYDLEVCAETVPFVQAGKVAACGWTDADSQQEKVALFVSVKIPSTEELTEKDVLRNVGQCVNEAMGFPLDYIIAVKSVPKTSSGKIQRYRLLKELLDGEHEKNAYLFGELTSSANDNIAVAKKAVSTEEQVRQIWATVLERSIEDIDVKLPFLKQGGSSIKAIKVMDLLETAFDIELGHEILLKCQTVALMATYIEQRLAGTKPAVDINTSRSKDQKQENNHFSGDIAVVSMACRFPKAASAEEFWGHIRDGQDLIEEVPGDRWVSDEFYDSSNQTEGSVNSRWGGFIEDAYDFDAGFFGVSEEEALAMDPQQRLVLTLCREALDCSGYETNGDEINNVGVFVGASFNNYMESFLQSLTLSQLRRFDSVLELNAEDRQRLFDEWQDKFGSPEIQPYTVVDNLLNMIAARTSQELNLKGPSFTVDSACSSSLVALHMACESIRRGECHMALAGGVNLLLTPTPYQMFSRSGALSPTGRCKVFDANADGFVPGEGGGIVLLKPLDKALADGDVIHGVIKGSWINNDGRSIGVMSPNPDGQKEVIAEAYRRFDLSPDNVSYVEAHGTGTVIGDHSEVRALRQVFSSYTDRSSYCAIGSVKANIGHLLSAAGIASFFKVLMALEHKQLPPSINLTKTNSSLGLDNSPFYLVRELAEWKVDENKSRCAAINSFGFGGTNCHLVLQEAPVGQVVESDAQIAQTPQLVCMSGRDATAIARQATALSSYLETRQNTRLADIAYSLNVRRKHYEYRTAVLAADTPELITELNKLASQTSPTANNKSPRVALMFTGQGAQYPGMGSQLYHSNPHFRYHLDMVLDLLERTCDEPVREAILNPASSEQALTDTKLSQPAIFAIDYALARVLIECGAKPDYVIGHSLGEYAAACIAGVMSLQDAVTIVTVRGRLMSELPANGGMIAVFADESQVTAVVAEYTGHVSVAAYNGSHVVVSGEQDTLDEITTSFVQQGVTVKPLAVSHAFHSHLMEPMLTPFAEVLEKITFHPPVIPVVSNINAEVVTNEQFDKDYWLKHITSPVRFSDGLRSIVSDSPLLCLEVGPKPTLAGLAKAIIGNNSVVSVVSSLHPKTDDSYALLQTLSQIYQYGVNLDWSKIDTGSEHRLVNLPPYMFNPSSYRITKALSSSRQAHVRDRLTALKFKQRKWVTESGINAGEPLPKGPVLIFADETGIADQLLNRFDKSHNPVVLVQSGDSFGRDENGNYRINVTNQADYAALVDDLSTQKNIPVAALHLSMCDEPAEIDYSLTNPDSLYQSLFSLSYFCQAWLSRLADQPLALTVVSKGAYQSASQAGDMPQPLSRMVSVWVSAACTEQARISCRTLDLATAPDASVSLDEGIYRCLTKTSVDDELRLEGETILRASWVASSDFKQVDTTETIAPGDTLIITGGATGVGYQLARSLAQQCALNLVLTGRQPVPPMSEWGNSSSPRIANLQRLSDLGAQVYYRDVDVTDADAMQALLVDVRNKFGRIDGVIHAAGIFDKQHLLAAQKSSSTIEKVLAAKVVGTINLDQLTSQDELKYFLSISSVSSTERALGSGLSDYAAANAFLDAFAEYRKASGGKGRSLTLNWPLWQGYGMGNEEWIINAVKQHGIAALSPDYAINVFRTLLQSAESGTYYIVGDLDQADMNRTDVQQAPQAEVAVASRVKSRPGRPLADVPASRSNDQKEILDIICQQLATRLGQSVQDIAITGNFVDLGVDSAMAIDFINDIGRSLNCELYPTLLFEYQTPQSLAGYISENISPAPDAVVAPTNFDHDVEEEKGDTTDIAIIGMACRLPGAEDTQQYWANLCQGKSNIREVPDERWSTESYFGENADALHKSYAKWGGFIDAPYDFEPMFFGISPKEAEAMDPQQRIFLEVAWTALQNAGYIGEDGTKNVGVYVGCEHNNYSERFMTYQRIEVLRQQLSDPNTIASMDANEREQLFDLLAQTLAPGEVSSDTVAGNGMNLVAARVNQCLDLTGPALAVNTACSSSLVALHMACDGLRNGDAEMAIAGGVSLNISSTPFVLLSQAKALSPDGTCTPFDKQANGMVLGEGAGALILKPMSKAVRDGDTVYAVIKGSAINNDGRSNGITAPKPDGQARVIRAAYEKSGLSPESISYIECHGTATSLGDPIEIQGMTQAFRSFTEQEQFCAIGSVKSSIGHLLSASGVASVIKVANMLQKKIIPPTVGYKEANPYIDFENSPFYVADSLQPWLTGGKVRRAGINAFGFGGTNCHILLEEAPDIKASTSAVQGQTLVCLSARSKTALQGNAKRLLSFLEKNTDCNIRDIAYSLSVGQRHFKHRTAIVVSERDDLIWQLQAISFDHDSRVSHRGSGALNNTPKVAISLSDNFNCDISELNVLAEYFPAFAPSFDVWLDEWQENIDGPASNTQDKLAMQYLLVRLLHAVGLDVSDITGQGQTVNVAEQIQRRLYNNESPQLSLMGADGQGVSGQLSGQAKLKPANKKSALTLQLGGNAEQKENAIVLQAEQGDGLINNLLDTFAALYIEGINLDWSQIFVAGNRVSLPGYAFERKTYQAGYRGQITMKENNTIQPLDIPKGLKPIAVVELSTEKKQQTYELLKADLVKL